MKKVFVVAGCVLGAIGVAYTALCLYTKKHNIYEVEIDVASKNDEKKEPERDINLNVDDVFKNIKEEISKMDIRLKKEKEIDKEVKKTEKADVEVKTEANVNDKKTKM